MPDIFDGSSDSEANHQTESSVESDYDPNSLDNQRQILRGVRTKRGFRRRAQKIAVDDQFTSDNSRRRQKKRSVDDYSEVMRRLPFSINPVTAFASKPVNTQFSTQSIDEEVILVLRRHPITQLRWIFIALLLAIAPFMFNSIDLLGFLPGSYQLAGLILWYLILLGFILESFLTWFFNVYIITDERIIDVDFLSLIYRNVSTAKIDNIEDVTATTGGVTRALFNFGTVTIQTAAEQREFEFEDVPRPAHVTKLINELLLEEEREKIEGRVS